MMALSQSSKLSHHLIEYLLALIALALLFYLLLGVALQAQFTLTDDHQILNIATWERLDFSTMWAAMTTNLVRGERFRPGYDLLYYTEVALFGLDPYLWHLAFLGYGLLTCFFFYIAARQIGADIISASLFVLLLALTGSQNSVWYRLGTGETWGMLLTSVAMLAIAKAAKQPRPNSWDAIALLFVLLAGLSKEAFILLIPSLLFLRLILQLWLHPEPWLSVLRKLLPLLGLGLFFFFVELALAGLTLVNRPEGYGPRVAGLSPNSFNPAQWYRLLAGSELATLTLYALLFWALLFVIVFRRSQTPERAHISPFLLAVLLLLAGWLTPQLILYSYTGFAFGHYLFPALVGPAAVCVLTLSVLWRWQAWPVWLVGVAMLAWPILVGVGPTTQRASSFTAQTLAFNQMVAYLAGNLSRDLPVIIVADPLRQTEWAISIRTHLRFAGLDGPIYLLPVYSETGPQVEAVTTNLIDDYFASMADLETFQPAEIGAIVAFKAPNSLTKVPAWFNPVEWRILTFAHPYCAFSFKELTCVKIGNYEHTMLIPAADYRQEAEAPVVRN